MTDREKAIVMAYTGIAMLTGEKIDEFYKYLAELYGRQVYTHEIVTLDIQEKAKSDFVELCRTEQPSAEPQRWIPCSERLPKENGDYLVTGRHGAVNKRKYEDGRWYGNWAIVAWMPLPEPWKGEEDE